MAPGIPWVYSTSGQDIRDHQPRHVKTLIVGAEYLIAFSILLLGSPLATSKYQLRENIGRNKHSGDWRGIQEGGKVGRYCQAQAQLVLTWPCCHQIQEETKQVTTLRPPARVIGFYFKKFKLKLSLNYFCFQQANTIEPNKDGLSLFWDYFHVLESRKYFD